MLDYNSLPFKAWALATVVLFLKMLGLSLVQGARRARFHAYNLPEDAKAFGGADAGAMAREADFVTRARGCWNNDLENIPIFLFVSLAFVLLAASPTWAPLLILAFCAVRFLHTFAYLFGWQPWRSLAFCAGALITFVMCLGVLYRAFVPA